jgi:hypothetical protein
MQLEGSSIPLMSLPIIDFRDRSRVCGEIRDLGGDAFPEILDGRRRIPTPKMI